MLIVLFFKAVFHHAAGWAGIGSTVATYMPESLRKRFGLDKEKRKFTFAIAGILLYVAVYQAWIDEHHNTEMVVAQRAADQKERDFWKQQSYDKDAAIRTKDSLLEKNISALADTQTAFANLSNKVLDITKPQALEVNTSTLQIPFEGRRANDNAVLHSAVVIAAPNRNLAMRVTIECEHAFIVSYASAIVKTRRAVIFPIQTDRLSDKKWKLFTESPLWEPTVPISVLIYSVNDSPGNCDVRPWQ